MVWRHNWDEHDLSLLAWSVVWETLSQDQQNLTAHWHIEPGCVESYQREFWPLTAGSYLVISSRGMQICTTRQLSTSRLRAPAWDFNNDSGGGGAACIPISARVAFMVHRYCILLTRLPPTFLRSLSETCGIILTEYRDSAIGSSFPLGDAPPYKSCREQVGLGLCTRMAAVAFVVLSSMRLFASGWQ